MSALGRVARRLRHLVARDSFERDLADELQFHIEMETARNIERGLPPQDARQRAELEFGRMANYKDEVRDVRGITFIDDIMRDLRHALRALRRTPAFTIVAVLCLALGIGANAAIFSAVHAVLLRPLPYAEPDRLVRIYQAVRGEDGWRGSVSWPNLVDWRAQSTGFEELVAWTGGSATLQGTEGPERVRVNESTDNLFRALGASALAGRPFTAGADDATNGSIVVLSEAFWRSRLGGDPKTLGSTLVLDGTPRTVIGIMPESFRFPVNASADVWIPHVPSQGGLTSRGNNYLQVIGRLKPGVTREQGELQLKQVAARLEEQYPATQAQRTVAIVGMHEDLTDGSRRALFVLLGAVGLVLLIACANVASLLLARAATRRQEVAVRLALGAGRGRLVRQFLVESLVLALLGGLVGAVLAHFALQALAPLAANALPRSAEIALDRTVFLYLLGASTLAGVAFGLVPALHASRSDVREHLVESSARTSGSAAQQRLRSALVVAEIALSLVLLVGAGLLMRGFVTLRSTPAGLEPAGVMTAWVSMSGHDVPSARLNDAFLRPVLERVRAIPGVTSVGAVSMLPIQQAWTNYGYAIVGEAPAEPGREPWAEARIATPGFFATLGIPVLAGRDFAPEDGTGGRKVVIVNETFAKRHFPSVEAALGRRLLNFGPDTLSIIGVVGNVRGAGLDRDPLPETYAPASDSGMIGWAGKMVLVMKSNQRAEVLVPQLRAALHAVAPTQPLYQVKAMDEVIEESLANRRLTLSLLGIFAAVALVLSAAGLYGVIAYLVAQRTREIGIRMALGASRREVLALVMRQGARLALFGVAIGLVGAFAFSRVLGNLLYGVDARDPLTFAVVSAVLGGSALLATLLPARRATRVDPMLAIRSE